MTENKLYIVSETVTPFFFYYKLFDHKPISVILGRIVAKGICYQMVIYFPTSRDYFLCIT